VIPAISCTAQGSSPSGDSAFCGGGGTNRTEGSNEFPCGIGASATLATYVCPVLLPDGAQIDEVRLVGRDGDAGGYFEGAIWRSALTSFAPQYFSPSFGGNWQSSGIAFSGGNANVLLYSSSDAPHTVDPNHRYQVGIGVRGTGSLRVYALRLTYTVF
jgi:hypothetical protein